MGDEVKKAFPLDWPSGWPRTATHNRTNGKFSKRETKYTQDGSSSYTQKKYLTVSDGIGRILESLRAMGISENDIVISTNVRTRLDGLPRSGEREPDDPGVAVYWRDEYGKKKSTQCMAIDRYGQVADNLAAVAATLEAMRAIERYGGAEILDRAFTGFLALPEKATEPWRDVLNLHQPVLSRDTVLAASRDLLLANNPDQGGDRDKYERIIEARKRALAEVTA